MESRFDFLGEEFPRLAGYGEKAEEVFSSDNNICLLNLGRIAETITEKLKYYSHIDEKMTSEEAVNELLNLEVISSEIAEKIKTLTAIKNEAAEEEYSSEMACSRLLNTAQELCEWFVLKHGESKFSFLADLFLPGRIIPPLANLAEIGREAEENLYTNTRYCLICLGDIGEAIVDYLMSVNSIETHQQEQLSRIDVLFKNYIIEDEIKDALHNLRIARNKAVHERYDNNYTSEAQGKKLLDSVLNLCEWLFRLVLKPGYIVKGRIAEISENNISVLIGNIPAEVPLSEIPLKEDGSIKKSYVKGKKYIFKVLDKTSEKITLSLRQADEDYKINIAMKYSKYRIGQEVRVFIKRISNSSGALVELKDGLEAQIPRTEMDRRLYDYDDDNQKRIKYEVLARVKWFSTTQYPPMLLSMKGLNNNKNKPQPHKTSTVKVKISDTEFMKLCEGENLEKVLKALKDLDANPNAKNNHDNTALMRAAEFNHDPKVIEALLDAGANINVKNDKGNTALHFAAMKNNYDVVDVLLRRGADIEALNKKKQNPLFYAKSNKSLNDTYIIKRLTPQSTEEEPKPEIKETEYKGEDNINARLLKLSKSGTAQEISEILEAGANVNTTTREKDTALHLAAGYNTSDVVMALINAGADVNAKNKEGKTPADIVKLNSKLKGSEAWKFLLSPVFQRDFLRICMSGSEEEISDAINSGVNVNIKNKSWTTALMLAANENTAEAVNMLIKAGAYLDAQNIYGKTALIYAASNNNEDVVNVLLEAGADITLTTTSGNSALDYAKRNYRLADSEVLEKLH